MQKSSRNYKQSAKTQIIEAIKIISYYLLFFISIVIYTNWAKIMLND